MKKKTTFLVPVLVLSLALITGCGNEGNNSSANESSSIESASVASVEAGSSDSNATSTDASTSASSDDATFEIPSGTYTMIFTEEIEGEEVSAEYSYTFFDDYTGIYVGQDILDFTWDEMNIIFEASTYTYEVLDDELIVDENGYEQNFSKRESDDPILNGDFSQFAASYVPTDSSSDGYGGGEPLETLTLEKDGSITGGGPTYNSEWFPHSAPRLVVKNNNGTYTCIYSENETYTIYPEGVAQVFYSENSKYSYLVDTVYINFFVFDGGVLDVTYYLEK